MAIGAKPRELSLADRTRSWESDQRPSRESFLGSYGAVASGEPED
jgi:hypothetical protein